MKSLIITLFFITCSSAYAYETDNLQDRGKIVALEDSGPELDNEVNKIIRHSLEIINETTSCDEDLQNLEDNDLPELYNVLKARLDTNPVAEIEKYAWENKKVSKYKPMDSVYEPKGMLDSVANLLDSRVMAVAGTQPSINLYGTITGVDKTGHFMAQGFEYFEKIKIRKKSIDDVLEYGLDLEETYYGLSTTGIKSYGDMGANFSGMSFWYNLLDGENPYIKCNEDGEYIQNRDFSWSEYVNDSWDEGVNCSDMKDSIKKAYTSNLKDFGHKRCPVDIVKCRKIVKLPCADKFVSPKCLEIVAETKSTCPETIEELQLMYKSPITPVCNPKLSAGLDELEELKEDIDDIIEQDLD